MESKAERREASRKFKERKTPRGIFAIRVAGGPVWVELARNLDSAKNMEWFGLRMGAHRNKELQAEWNARGEESFEFEVLEVLDDDVLAIGHEDLLKERRAAWAERLGARKI